MLQEDTAVNQEAVLRRRSICQQFDLGLPGLWDLEEYVSTFYLVMVMIKTGASL